MRKNLDEEIKARVKAEHAEQDLERTLMKLKEECNQRILEAERRAETSKQETEKRGEAAIFRLHELKRDLHEAEKVYKEKAEQKLDSRSALMVASKQGNCQEVKSLLDGGSRVNFQDKDGWSALMVASQWGKHEVAQLLLDHGADQDMQSVDWESPLSLALLQQHSDMVALLCDEVL